MNLKNYTVKAETIKKDYDYMIYLTDKEHKNHKGKTEKIVELIGDTESFFDKASKEFRKAEMKKVKERKGGKPSKNLMRGFTLNFPNTVKPDEMEMRKILFLIYQDMSEFLSVPPNEPKKKKDTSDEAFKATMARYKKAVEDFEPLSFEEFRDISLSVLHDQENKHIHLMLPAFFKGKSFQAIKSPAFLNALKKSFTNRTDEIMNVSFKDYQISKDYNKGYSMASIKQDKKVIDESIDTLKKSLETLLIANPDDKLLNQALADLNKGHTIKAEKKINKYVLKIQ